MSDLETEKADADLCHKNLYFVNLFWLMKRSLLSAIIVANCVSEISGERDTKKCTCSGFA